uniref:Arrestin-like N-terminal domain-containing protein n=1 Tax=Salarias fasciatus TaxID=181472 RepID=A0A672FK31_SALFA
MTVKHLSIEYDKVNDRGTVSPGDVLSGKVTVVTSKETKVQCFVVKAKGKAKVTWYEEEGQSTAVYCNERKYFHLEHIILQDKQKGDGGFIVYIKLQEQQCATRISFYGSGKITMKVTSEKMGLKQGKQIPHILFFSRVSTESE